MKKIYLLALLVLSGAFASAQVLDQFNYTGAADANGWTNHSVVGNAGQISTLTTASDNGSSLNRAGMPAPVGNRITTIAGNAEDINKALSFTGNTGYFSFLLKVSSVTGIATAGDYFTGFGATTGTNVTVLAARTFIKPGSVAGTFQLGIQNTTGGTPTQTYTGDYPLGTTVLVVVKLVKNTSPIQASLFVNPVLGGTEPAATVTNTSGTATFATFGSVFIRQNGSAASGTGTLELDEFRAGETWASVTPSGCATVNNMTVSNCGSYTLNGTTYAASGNYQQVLTNANAAGCDSTINLALTVKQPTTSTLTETACGSYTLNGTTYSASGTYTQVLTNAVGCDSTITLNLTIASSVTYYQDLDGDGFGNAAVTQTGCAAISGYVTNDDDCNDNNNAIGAATVTYYQDLDADGFGNPAVSQIACTQPAGYVTTGNDCNDNNNAVGVATNWYPDADGDGYGSAAATAVSACTAPANHVASNNDCNDSNNAIHPGATEIPDNGIDEDCSGSDLSTALGTYEFTATGACPVTAVDVTAQPANATFGPYTTANTTCAAANNVFNNSDWNMTADVDLTEYNQFYITPADCYSMDLTGMSFDHKISASGGTPFVHVRSSLDDFAADIYSVQIMNANLVNVSFTLPAAFTDITDTLFFRIYVTQMGTTGATYRNDNVKLNGTLSALATQTYYADADGDGFGNPAATITGCEAPEGYVSNSTDCDDTNANAFPGAVWYQDADSDSFGNAAVSITQCTQPAGYVHNNTDCNDNDNTITGETVYYADADGDGFGESGSVGVSACSAAPGYVTNADDCNDEDNTVHPGAVEICDGIDNNCDGQTDEGLTAVMWYQDADGDSYGNADEAVSDCAQPTGYVANNTDCNDDNPAVNPGATDIANNGIDENCDGTDGYLSIDENAFGSVSVFPNPGTSEVTVKLASAVSGAKAQLISAEGKLIAEQEVTNEETVINTVNILPGVYFVKISNASSATIVRWIKK